MRDQETIEQACERIVRQEVLCCVSGLVHTLASSLANGCGSLANSKTNGPDLAGLCEKAYELSCSVSDWEEAATQAGWTGPHTDKYGATYFENATESSQNMTWCAKDWESLCADFDIEPYEWEVFEHWAVTQWLADALIEQDERVDTDFEGLCVWARTTTGQGIAMDSVIRRIVEKLQADYAALTAKPGKATAEKLPIYKPHGLGL